MNFGLANCKKLQSCNSHGQATSRAAMVRACVLGSGEWDSCVVPSAVAESNTPGGFDQVCRQHALNEHLVGLTGVLVGQVTSDPVSLVTCPSDKSVRPS